MITRRFLMLAGLLGLLLSTVSPSYLSTARAASCYGTYCNDKDADQMACGTRTAVRSKDVYAGTVRIWLILWKSDDCRAVWTEIISEAPGSLYTAVTQNGEQYTSTAKSCTNCTRIKSLMRTSIWTPNLVAYGRFNVNGYSGAYLTSPPWQE